MVAYSRHRMGEDRRNYQMYNLKSNGPLIIVDFTQPA
jgi:hypothetical protein